MHACCLFISLVFKLIFVLFSFLLKRNFKAKEPEKIVRVSVHFKILHFTDDEKKISKELIGFAFTNKTNTLAFYSLFSLYFLPFLVCLFNFVVH